MYWGAEQGFDLSAKGDELVVIYVLFPNAGEAVDACRKLMEERLIASAMRMSPGISHYEWMGEMQSSEEHPVIIKTTAARADAAVERLAKLHSYDVPAILQWPVAKANPGFADWVIKMTGGGR